MLFQAVLLSLTNANRAVTSNFLHHIRYYKILQDGVWKQSERLPFPAQPNQMDEGAKAVVKEPNDPVLEERTGF